LTGFSQSLTRVPAGGDILRKTKYQPVADLIENIKEKRKLAVYHEYLKYF